MNALNTILIDIYLLFLSIISMVGSVYKQQVLYLSELFIKLVKHFFDRNHICNEMQYNYKFKEHRLRTHNYDAIAIRTLPDEWGIVGLNHGRTLAMTNSLSISLLISEILCINKSHF